MGEIKSYEIKKSEGEKMRYEGRHDKYPTNDWNVMESERNVVQTSDVKSPLTALIE